MTNRLRTIRIAVTCSAYLFAVPILMGYVIMPLFYMSLSSIEDKAYVVQRILYVAQTLIPVSSILWPMAHLQIRVGEDGWEAMRACKRGNSTCLWDLILLELLFLTMLFPLAAAFSVLFEFRIWDFVRLTLQILFAYGVLYLLSIIMRSVSMSGMVVISYFLFSTLFAGTEGFESICIIHNSLLSFEDAISHCLPILVLIVICHGIGYCLEKKWTPR